MASALEDSSASEQPRFGTVVMNDGSVMKIAVDVRSCDRSNPRRTVEASQAASLKALRDSVKAVLHTKQDDVTLNILMYVIYNEPVSIYRVAKAVPYYTSLTYKKANRLLRDGLIRQAPAGASKDHRCRRLFESTVKGLLVGWDLGYLDDSEIYRCLKSKWAIGDEEFSKLRHVFKLIPGIVSARDTAVLQDTFVLAAAATAYESCKPKSTAGTLLEQDEGKKYASRYVLGKALRRLPRGRTVAFSSDKYAISYELDKGRTYVYECALCDRKCSMAEVSPRSPKCDLLNRLLSSFSVQASPGS